MTNIEAMLVGFHRAEAERPFAWGRHDCSLRLADWWQYMHEGDDPAAFLRGTYHSRAAAAVACLKAGGLTRLVGSIAINAGADPLPTLAIGAFGVATVAGGPRGYIATRDMISLRSEEGIAFINPDQARIHSIWGVA